MSRTRGRSAGRSRSRRSTPRRAEMTASTNATPLGNQALLRLAHSQVVQTQLKVNAPDDRFEVEANRVADQVMRMPESESVGASFTGEPPAVQRLCADCQDDLQRQTQSEPIQLESTGDDDEAVQMESTGDEDEQVQMESTGDEDEEVVQAETAAGPAPAVTPGVQSGVQAARQSGQPMSGSDRTFFESRFGRDFGDVRVHQGSKAEASTRQLNARAYTVGSDIVFGAGEYAPGTPSGRHLMAHELTHVVQQTGVGGESGAGQPHTIGRQPVSAAASHIQRLGDPSQFPSGLACPMALDSPGSVVRNVLFPISSSALTPAAQADLASFIAEWEAAGADRPVRVDGFASVDGPQALNWRLSCDRGLIVENELLAPSSGAPGIPASFLETFAQGETDEFGADLGTNRRATVSADLSAPPPPACDNPGVSRTLELQPVFLRTDPTDPNPTGNSWTRRLNESNTIWGKLGVTFVELGPVTVDTPLKTGGNSAADAAAIRALRNGAGVEVFLVENDLPGSGGANTLPPIGAGCDATGSIIMSDLGTSDTLLAHELGHILGLDHPTDPPPFNPGDPGTIMEGSGSNSIANPTRNTLVNFTRILCPDPTGTTCLNPDA